MSYSPSYNSNQQSNNLLGGEITADELNAAEEGVSNTQRLLPNPTSLSSSNNVGGGGGGGEGIANQSIWQQSAHPVALFFLYIFRILAITTYLLCGFFSSSYVFSTVLVVVLLALDFWTVRNVSGRTLVGLRFWNQVDEDGSSYWVFEHRNPESQPANAVDSKMFWIAMYTFPAAWILLLFIGLLKFNLSFLPIVLLALVFNMSCTMGFTYADRDAKRKWASGTGGMLGSLAGGLGGGMSGMMGSLASNYIGKIFG